jgi:hypothetical protein
MYQFALLFSIRRFVVQSRSTVLAKELLWYFSALQTNVGTIPEPGDSPHIPDISLFSIILSPLNIIIQSLQPNKPTKKKSSHYKRDSKGIQNLTPATDKCIL